MKNLTQKSIEAKDARITDRRNFMKKSIFKISIVFLFFIFSSKVNAQVWWFEVNNTSSCSGWTVTAFDALNNQLDQITSTTSPPYVPSNVCPQTTQIDHFVITPPGPCSPSSFTFTQSLNIFVNTSISKTCCGGNSVTISESIQTTCGVNTHHIVIGIL